MYKRQGYSTLEWSSGNQGFALTASGKYQPDNFPTILNSNGRIFNKEKVQICIRDSPDTLEEVARVHNLKELQNVIFAIPKESLLYHISRNHV